MDSARMSFVITCHHYIIAERGSYVSDRIELKRSKIEDHPPSVHYTFSFFFVYLLPRDTVKSVEPGIELFSSP